MGKVCQADHRALQRAHVTLREIGEFLTVQGDCLMSDLPPDLQVFAVYADLQPPQVRAIFQYALAMMLLGAGPATGTRGFPLPPHFTIAGSQVSE